MFFRVGHYPNITAVCYAGGKAACYFGDVAFYYGFAAINFWRKLSGNVSLDMSERASATFDPYSVTVVLIIRFSYKL